MTKNSGENFDFAFGVTPTGSSIEKSKARRAIGIDAEFLPEIDDFKTNRSNEITNILGGSSDREIRFQQWTERFLRAAEKYLRKAYIDYGVLPSFILEVLGRVKARELIYDPILERKRRSLKLRKKAAEILTNAVKIAEDHVPDSPDLLCRVYDGCSAFRELAERLKRDKSATGRSQTPQNYYGRIAAYQLSAALRRFDLGEKRYDSALVQDLIEAAFPDCVFSDDPNDYGDTNKDVDRKIREGRQIVEAQRYPNLRVEGLLCRHPRSEKFDDDSWHFHPKCSRWPNTDFLEARFLDPNDTRLCGNCARLQKP